MGGSRPSRLVTRRSESSVPQRFRNKGSWILFPRMRMMRKRRGGIGAVTVTPVRCSTGPARPACLMTLVLLLLRLPDGEVPLRRERPMAASTGRAPGTQAPPVAGERERTSPRLLLRPRRPGASGEGVGRRRGDLLARTFASWTRSVQGTQLLVRRRWFPQVDRLRRGTGPASLRSSTHLRSLYPLPRRPMRMPGWGKSRLGWQTRVLMGHWHP